MITMKDVADKAQVSRKTVYNVINNKGSFSKEVEEKVKKAIKELNYKESLIAKSLKTGKTNLIGVVMPDIFHPSYSQFLVSFEKEARLNDYNIIVCNYDYKKDLEAYYFEMLYKRGVDGIAYYPFILDDYNYYYDTNVKRFSSVPTVFFGDHIFNKDYSSVFVDNINVFDAIFKDLFEMNCKKPIYISNAYYDEYDNDSLREMQYCIPRLIGYKTYCKKNNLEPEIWTYYRKSAEKHNREEIIEKIKQCDYDSIICDIDYVALKIIEMFKSINKPLVPVIGFDNSDMAKTFSPTISSVDYNYDLVAKETFNLLLNKMNGQTNSKQVLVNCEFVKRESTENFKKI